ncbi:MAG: fused response regulator/phosphatase [Spirochaetes bacterium]|nr:fused response regulator/phosphatase [Spirochaetota bacterium]MBU1079126.1 fused response regulator/phosphatase [Spirochaetota bacterium]
MSDASYTVLIVDDSGSNRAFLASILEEDGYRIAQASDGEACLAAAATERPVLILLDVVMPGMDGFEALRRLKADPATRRIAVIMLTSLGDQESKLKAFDFGAIDYIVKSANEAEVRARVRVHVRLAKANEELVEARAESLKQIAAAQRSLLVNPSDLPEARFSVYYRSLHEAGGDFYDVVPVSDGVYFYLMADVAGHDVGTSYVTPAVKVLLKQCATPAHSVEEALSYLNGVLSKTILEDNYLTAFALRINRRAGKAVFAAAGHPPALYIPREGPVSMAACENPFVGMLEESMYRSESMEVREGDRFLLYTDGLVENRLDLRSSADSSDRLIAAAGRLRTLPLADLPVAFVREMGADRPEDDVAVMAVEV